MHEDINNIISQTHTDTQVDTQTQKTDTQVDTQTQVDNKHEDISDINMEDIILDSINNNKIDMMDNNTQTDINLALVLAKSLIVCLCVCIVYLFVYILCIVCIVCCVVCCVVYCVVCCVVLRIVLCLCNLCVSIYTKCNVL